MSVLLHSILLPLRNPAAKHIQRALETDSLPTACSHVPTSPFYYALLTCPEWPCGTRASCSALGAVPRFQLSAPKFRLSHCLLSSEYRFRQWSPSKSSPGTGESQSQLIQALEYLREARPRREITQAIGPHSTGKETLFHACGILKIFVSILKFGKSHINPQISSFSWENHKLSRIGLNFIMVTVSWSWAVAPPKDTCPTIHKSIQCSLRCKGYLMLPWHWWFSNSREPFLHIPVSMKSKKMNKRKGSLCIWRHMQERDYHVYVCAWVWVKEE